jgi:hypothetical protein
MFQPGVQNLFDTMQLGPPEVAHFVEASVDFVEARIYVDAQIANARVRIV